MAMTKALETALKSVIENYPIDDETKQKMLDRLAEPEAQTLPRLVTGDEAAKILHVSTQTIRRWIRTGRLHPRNKGRRYLLSVDELV